MDAMQQSIEFFHSTEVEIVKRFILGSASNNYIYYSYIFLLRGMARSHIICEKWLYNECSSLNEFHTLNKCSIVYCKHLWNHLYIWSLMRFELSNIQVVVMSKVNKLAWILLQRVQVQWYITNLKWIPKHLGNFIKFKF